MVSAFCVVSNYSVGRSGDVYKRRKMETDILAETIASNEQLEWTWIFLAGRSCQLLNWLSKEVQAAEWSQDQVVPF